MTSIALLNEIERLSPRISFWKVTQVKEVIDTDGNITRKVEEYNQSQNHSVQPDTDYVTQTIEHVDNVIRYIKWWGDTIKDLQTGKVLNREEVSSLYDYLKPQTEVVE